MLMPPRSSARAVVTGASSGIGMALARTLAARGHSVILVARRENVLHELAIELRSRFQVDADVRAADLSDLDAVDALCDELSSREISILCNNAGIATFGPLAGLDSAYERAQVRLNANAVHDLTLAVLPQMVERGSGGILMVGSAAGNMPIPNNATYAATKAFVNTFSESLRGELKDTGVHVTLLAPGPVRTHTPTAEEASIVDKLVPGFLWHDSQKVAEMSLDALSRNKMRVVPGTLSKAMSVAGGYSPRAVVAPIVGKFYSKLGEGE
ncbi:MULTISPECIES: mycolate reductase [Gordonia]|uniref:Mycolate reductase n=2 Tax=Gordonia TaxID=2053 RepID=A0ABN3HA72_9ACTN|nr:MULTISPECIES: mycolate reductase [Gordonia]AUH70399.1 NAD(P)-dependent oxidoreductase [Gordonia sp. YC-JH1]KJR00715.1 short-chain dehydrogenase [Gordonia sihwensis]KXT56597.1 short-chain dehydrogenase [Gordonia sp. QH-12]MBY4571773.1 short-chain dehydrogenase [Gordonia sihwensis]WFN94301.1 mycolate reductase [Gordonia sihwensis]